MQHTFVAVDNSLPFEVMVPPTERSHGGFGSSTPRLDLVI